MDDEQRVVTIVYWTIAFGSGALKWRIPQKSFQRVYPDAYGELSSHQFKYKSMLIYAYWKLASLLDTLSA